MALKDPKELAYRNAVLMGLIGAVIFVAWALVQVVAGKWSPRGCWDKGGAESARSAGGAEDDGHGEHGEHGEGGHAHGSAGRGQGRETSVWGRARGRRAPAPGRGRFVPSPSSATTPSTSPGHPLGGMVSAAGDSGQGGPEVILPTEGPRPGEEPPGLRMPGAILAPDLYKTVPREDHPMVPPPPPAPRSASEALGRE